MTRLPGNTPLEKLEQNFIVDGECFRWTGAHTGHGYGHLKVGDSFISVHILAWTLVNGPVPNGLELDHNYNAGCRFKDCYRIKHLEPVTHQVNLQRRAALKTTFGCGHKRDTENTVMKSSGHAQPKYPKCRKCINKRNAAWKRKTRATN